MGQRLNQQNIVHLQRSQYAIDKISTTIPSTRNSIAINIHRSVGQLIENVYSCRLVI